jgi:hypothetical protein
MRRPARTTARRSTQRHPRRKIFLAIAGNIGAGKSSLTRLLSERMRLLPFFESVEDNPYLNDFYGDMKRWSFNLQVYFLSNRFRSHKVITEGPGSVILDRVIYEDAEIFARNLYEIGKMEDRDYRNYTSLYGVMTEYLRPPDLLIYLRANVDTLLHQISLRGREFEKSITREYLEQLNRHYEGWIGRYDRGKLMVVESDSIDFVNNPGDLDKIVRMAESRLGIRRRAFSPPR